MSLHENTQIMMVDGSKKKISDVCIGDIVKTYDAHVKIINIFRGWEESLVEIKTIDGISIQLTEDHMIMVDDGWKEASELKVGDILQKDDKIVSIGDVPGCEVYDIEADSDGTGIYANDIVVGDFSMNNSFKMSTKTYLKKNTGSNNDMLTEMIKTLEDLNR